MTRDKIITAHAKGARCFAHANLTGANLTGADLTGADLTGAYLASADLIHADLTGANLRNADLTGANLSRANLTGADLTGADLTGADLTGANLSRANLTGADLGTQWIIQGPARQDGYCFFLQKLTADEKPMIKAGCRHFTLANAREHWTNTRKETPLGDETFAILDHLETLARIRGYIS